MSMAAAMDTDQLAGEMVFRRAVAGQASLYAVIDAARGPEAIAAIKEAGSSCRSLLQGEFGEKLGEVAPYITAFRADSSFGQWWFEQWGHSVGLLLQAPVALDELRTHFRTLLIVRHEDGHKYYFRFYDPRVLRVFLPTCTADEVRRFFGPVTAVYCEGARGEELLTFRPDRSGVSVKRSPCSTGAAR